MPSGRTATKSTDDLRKDIIESKDTIKMGVNILSMSFPDPDYIC